MSLITMMIIMLRVVFLEPLIDVSGPFRTAAAIIGFEPFVTLFPPAFYQDQRSSKPGGKPFPISLPRQTGNDPGRLPVPGADADLIIKIIPHAKGDALEGGGGGVKRLITDRLTDGVQIHHQVTGFHVVPDVCTFSAEGGTVDDKGLFSGFRETFVRVVMRMALLAEDLNIIWIDSHRGVRQILICQMFLVMRDQMFRSGG